MASVDGTCGEEDEVQFESLEDKYDELLAHSHALSSKYKLMKNFFSQLQKDFDTCKNENLILSKENEELK